MISYKQFERDLKNKKLPIAGTINGDTSIVSKGKDEAGSFYQTRTAQKNGWIRVNTYYEDGTVTETFEK